MLRNLLGGLLVISVTAEVRADLIAEWNFNGPSAGAVLGGNATPLPIVANTAATASLVGNTTATMASGTSNGGSSDLVITTPDNYAWNTTNYPVQGTGNKTAGVQFNVSTAGYESIVVEWDARASNTSARHQQFQYSLDGSNFVDFGSLFENTGGDTWYNNRSMDLASIVGANNNPSFAFRLVTAFDPANPGNYAASGTAYAGTGTLRFDMVQVNGIAIPEPTAFALLGVTGFALALRRRR